MTSGKHMICDIKGIKNVNILNNGDALNGILCSICTTCNFQILKKIQYDFTPQGCTILFLLSESHISLHSFPEKNHISLDLYTCREYEDDTEYNVIYKFLLDILDASENSTIKIIDRYF